MSFLADIGKAIFGVVSTAASFLNPISAVAQGIGLVASIFSPPARDGGGGSSYSKEERDEIRNRIAESKDIIRTTGDRSRDIGLTVMRETFGTNREMPKPPSSAVASFPPRGLVG